MGLPCDPVGVGPCLVAYPASADPDVYPGAVNLFYFNNIIHDYLYSIGFTESLWNFQLESNYLCLRLEPQRTRPEGRRPNAPSNALRFEPPDQPAHAQREESEEPQGQRAEIQKAEDSLIHVAAGRR